MRALHISNKLIEFSEFANTFGTSLLIILPPPSSSCLSIIIRCKHKYLEFSKAFSTPAAELSLSSTRNFHSQKKQEMKAPGSGIRRGWEKSFHPEKKGIIHQKIEFISRFCAFLCEFSSFVQIDSHPSRAFSM